MAVPYGITATGFVGKTYEQILSEISDSIRADISESMDLSTASPMGQLAKIFAERERFFWELLEATYAAQYPDSASGFSLTSVAALTGTIREAGSYSTVVAQCTLAAGTYNAGTLVAYVFGREDELFENTEQIVSAGAVENVEMQARNKGPIRADAGDLTERIPVTGWTVVTNALDAALGALEESDTELRARRLLELARRGSTHAAAIAVDLLDVPNVTAAVVVPNDTDTTDGDGIPPHSIRTIVLGGTDEAVAQQILESKAAGIGTFGGESVVVVDSQGISHTINFDRPTGLNLYLTLSVDVDLDIYGGDDVAVEALIKQALVDFGDANLSVGDDVIRARLIAEVFAVPGVLDVPTFTLGFSASPVGTSNLAVAPAQIALFDTSRISVTAT